MIVIHEDLHFAFSPVSSGVLQLCPSSGPLNPSGISMLSSPCAAWAHIFLTEFRAVLCLLVRGLSMATSTHVILNLFSNEVCNSGVYRVHGVVSLMKNIHFPSFKRDRSWSTYRWLKLERWISRLEHYFLVIFLSYHQDSIPITHMEAHINHLPVSPLLVLLPNCTIIYLHYLF